MKIACEGKPICLSSSLTKCWTQKPTPPLARFAPHTMLRRGALQCNSIVPMLAHCIECRYHTQASYHAPSSSCRTPRHQLHPNGSCNSRRLPEVGGALNDLQGHNQNPASPRRSSKWHGRAANGWSADQARNSSAHGKMHRHRGQDMSNLPTALATLATPTCPVARSV